MEKEIYEMQNRFPEADLIIVGDMNARISEITEWEASGEQSKYPDMMEYLENNIPSRRNKDKEKNEYGNRLI